jgi:hypothetical protein
MSNIINTKRRSVPPLPDPRDTDQGRINHQTIEVIKFLVAKIQSSGTEDRLNKLESSVKKINEQLK